MFAITSDGTLLINILALEEDAPPPLARRRGVFVGVALTKKETKLLSVRAYDATSEVAATISGQRRRRRK
jgi:hypothetical protein